MGCVRRAIGCLVWFVVAIIILSASAYLLLFYFVKEKLSDEIRRYFMLPPSARVAVSYGSPLDTLLGKIEALDLVSAEGRVGGLVVRDLRLHAEDLGFSIPNLLTRKGPIIKHVGDASVSFGVTTSEITRAWLEKGSAFGLRQIKVSLKPSPATENRIIADVDAKVVVLNKSFDISVSGIFSVTDDQEIAFKPEKFQASQLKIGAELLGDIFVRFAPKIRVKELQKELKITHISLTDHTINIGASTQSSSKPEDKHQTK